MGLGRDIAYGVGVGLTSPLWGVSLLRSGKWRTDWAGRFGHTAYRGSADRKTLLIYGVSVGEVGLIRPMIEHLEQTQPDLRVVIAAATNTGHARAVSLYGQKHPVVRFPYDFSRPINRFLDAVKPDAVALVELEVWPNFMEACEKRGIPVAVINGRLTARSYKGYRRALPLIRKAFSRLSAVAAQSEDYAERFVGLGVPQDRVKVLDTMKWDAAVVADDVEGSSELAQAMGIDRSKPLIVAGSTAPGEDKLLIETCPQDVQLLIAPRKPEWFDAVMKITPDAVRRTEHQDDAPAAEPGKSRIFLLDTIGELRKAYALADVCVVGRSFTGNLYGSDMMEPIALGKPTVIGPYYKDFAETMKALLSEGGVIVSEEPGGTVDELLRNKTLATEIATAGRAVILSRQGSAQRHAELLMELLENDKSLLTTDEHG